MASEAADESDDDKHRGPPARRPESCAQPPTPNERVWCLW